MHEAGEAEEPCGGHPVVTGPVAPADDQLREVDDEPGGVTQQEHDHDADQDSRQVHLVMGGTITICRSDVGISKME